jgi:DNA modification methylase
VTPYYESAEAVVYHGDCREVLPRLSASVDLVFTSPPYFAQREYGDHPGELGREDRPQVYLRELVEVARRCANILSPNGHMLVNLGDKYNADGPVKVASAKAGSFNGARRQPRWSGMSLKSLMMLPARFAIACTDDLGLALRGEIIWHQDEGGADGKATDRVRRSHEVLYHFTPARKHGQASAIYSPPGSSVWRVPVSGGSEHSADFPLALAERAVKCWSAPGGTVLDPFMGSGTTLVAAVRSGRKAIGIDTEERHCELFTRRMQAPFRLT